VTARRPEGAAPARTASEPAIRISSRPGARIRVAQRAAHPRARRDHLV